MSTASPLFELTRGAVIEAVHSGSVAVVCADGSLIKSLGDPYTVAFLRSSAKPFQALPFVEAGGVEHYKYTQAELAISCASHETAQMHLDTVQAMQAKIGIEEQHLQCGPHLPGDADKLREVIKLDIHPTANFNNCSGKHTSMLAFAKMMGQPLETYLELHHPIQQAILHTLGEMCRISPQEIQLGTDGCSAPNFAMPLFNAALGMARLCDPYQLPEPRDQACQKITAAMSAHPEMVGHFGEFDTELMRTAQGKVITKRGAEGFQIVGIMPGVIHEHGVGIAIKVIDGDKSSLDDDLHTHVRVRPPITLEILRQLGALSESQVKALAGFGPETQLRNYAGLPTGKSKPVFTL